MHTEGSVIFADNAVFDKKGQRRERWREGAARRGKLRTIR
jgi:hypothetical protein